MAPFWDFVEGSSGAKRIHSKQSKRRGSPWAWTLGLKVLIRSPLRKIDSQSLGHGSQSRDENE